MTKIELIEFPKHVDLTGTLFVADQPDLPFVPQRVFWMTGLRGRRGGHALRSDRQVIFALRGQFDVRAKRYRQRAKRWTLKFPHHGLYLPGMTWRDLIDFSTDSIALVLCSKSYNPDDYIHDFSNYLQELDDGFSQP